MGGGVVGFHMGWLRRLLGRGATSEPLPKTFEEIEEEMEDQIAQDYAEKKSETIDSILDEFEDETMSANVPQIEDVPVAFHVDEAEADDLLEDTPMEDHYGMNVGDEVDLSTADSHLVEAADSNSDMEAYTRIEVPVMDDDIEWEKE